MEINNEFIMYIFFDENSFDHYVNLFIYQKLVCIYFKTFKSCIFGKEIFVLLFVFYFENMTLL